MATIAEHVTAPILLIQAVAPHMKARGFGRIVNVLSTYANKGSWSVIAYTVAKSALATVTSAMSRELGPDGVTVNAVAPGNIDTEMMQSAPGRTSWTG